MNGKEFDLWWTDFKIRFPDLGGPWFAEGRSESQQRVALSNFAEVLADVSLSEAKSVNKAMQRGDLESFSGKWDRDDIAKRVRVHAIAQRPQATTWTGPDDPDPFPQPADTKPVELHGTLGKLLKMQADGATKAECDEFLRRQFPAQPLHDQRRFKCAVCLDLGRIEVWHWELVARIKAGDQNAIKTCLYRTASAACSSCGAGEMFASRKLPLVRYDATKHCRVRNADTTSEAAIKDLTDWLADQVKGVNRPNYDPLFAEYGG